eukprot:GEZU01032860.1.p1 GENE.GEZU01032860.1~~GEZU01032860.1.p1  ORF type:complete len:501 (-),score=102.83 GEZU01032860.1:122-1624(-)
MFVNNNNNNPSPLPAKKNYVPLIVSVILACLALISCACVVGLYSSYLSPREGASGREINSSMRKDGVFSYALGSGQEVLYRFDETSGGLNWTVCALSNNTDAANDGYLRIYTKEGIKPPTSRSSKVFATIYVGGGNNDNCTTIHYDSNYCDPTTSRYFLISNPSSQNVQFQVTIRNDFPDDDYAVGCLASTGLAFVGCIVFGALMLLFGISSSISLCISTAFGVRYFKQSQVPASPLPSNSISSRFKRYCCAIELTAAVPLLAIIAAALMIATFVAPIVPHIAWYNDPKDIRYLPLRIYLDEGSRGTGSQNQYIYLATNSINQQSSDYEFYSQSTALHVTVCMNVTATLEYNNITDASSEPQLRVHMGTTVSVKDFVQAQKPATGELMTILSPSAGPCATYTYTTSDPCNAEQRKLLKVDITGLNANMPSTGRIFYYLSWYNEPCKDYVCTTPQYRQRQGLIAATSIMSVLTVLAFCGAVAANIIIRRRQQIYTNLSGAF